MCTGLLSEWVISVPSREVPSPKSHLIYVSLPFERSLNFTTRGSLEEAAKQTYDLIIVNILARVIIGMCEDGLGRIVRPGGLAIFAGLIDTQEYGVREALQTQGLRVIDRLQEKDWVCLIAKRED